MGKFAEAIGLLELNISNVKVELKPKMGDNKKLASIITGYQRHKEQGRMLNEICDFVFELVVREDSSLIDEDKEELRLALEMNQIKVMENILVAFRWTTQDELDKAKTQDGDVAKNLMKAVN